MRSQRIVHIVSCHAEGEVGDVIVGGVAAPPAPPSGNSRAGSPETRTCATSSSTNRAAECSATPICWCRPRTRARRWAGSSWSRPTPADVRFQFAVRGHRTARQRHPADARTADPAAAGSAGRADRGPRGMPRQQGRAGGNPQRAVVRRPPRRLDRSRGPRLATGRHRLRRRQLRHRRRPAPGLRPARRQRPPELVATG